MSSIPFLAWFIWLVKILPARRFSFKQVQVFFFSNRQTESEVFASFMPGRVVVVSFFSLLKSGLCICRRSKEWNIFISINSRLYEAGKLYTLRLDFNRTIFSHLKKRQRCGQELRPFLFTYPYLYRTMRFLYEKSRHWDQKRIPDYRPIGRLRYQSLSDTDNIWIWPTARTSANMLIVTLGHLCLVSH